MSGSPGDERRPGLSKAAEIATIIGAVGTVIAIVVTLVLAFWPNAETTVTPLVPSSSTLPDITAGDDCAQAGNACPTDHLVVGVDDCSLPGVLRAWGMDPQLDSLLIDAAADGDSCQVAPNQVARDAGVSADDVIAAQDGVVADGLRECARRSGADVVACNEPHEIEFVGPAFDFPSGQDSSSKCSALTRRYASISFDPGGDVNYGVIDTQDGALTRCALIFERGSSHRSLRNTDK